MYEKSGNIYPSSDEIKNSIKKNIVILRKQNGLKMRDVAKAINVNENTYRIWEDPKRSCPKPSDIVKLAQLYNVSSDFILGNNTSPPSLSLQAQNQYNLENSCEYLSSLDSFERLLLLNVRRLTLEQKRDLIDEVRKMIDSNEIE